MPIDLDLDALLNEGDNRPLTDPVAIFKQRPPASRYKRLRGDQQSILERWTARREERDCLIKMNTGGGKTAVGLLILQSLLNDGLGPALYVCPDWTLVSQVLDEAAALGVEAIADENIISRAKFRNCEAVLVTVAHKLFNGESWYGIDGGSKKATVVGSIVFDDAHACLAILRGQATLSLPRSDARVNQFLASRFRAALDHESTAFAAEVIAQRGNVVLPIPYWSWHSALSDMSGLISTLAEEGGKSKNEVMKSIFFAWPILRPVMEASNAFVARDFLEVSTPVCPTHIFPSVEKAKRRIYMTATLVDDSQLSRDFGVDPGVVQRPLQPTTYGDIGERMILLPSLFDRQCEETAVIEYARRVADSGENVVVLVPNKWMFDPWKKVGATCELGDNVANLLQKLKSSSGNLVVLANRYDGIDLPGSACRLLILHGLPRAARMSERYVDAAWSDSIYGVAATVQRIEQGLGRAVRSEDDWAAVLLIGNDLCDFVGNREHLKFFSPETRAQIELGLSFGQKLLGNQGMAGVESAVNMCLAQDPKWKRLHRERVVRSQTQVPIPSLAVIAQAERDLFLATFGGDVQAAVRKLDAAVRASSLEESAKAWYRQIEARHLHAVEPDHAAQLQVSAHAANRGLLKPISGVKASTVTRKITAQGQGVLKWLSVALAPNSVVVKFNAVLEHVAFTVESDEAEAAFKELGLLLGYDSWRPEKESGAGPDNIWQCPNAPALLFELKTETKEGKVDISRRDGGQLHSHVKWYREQFQHDQYVGVLMHPSRQLADDATLPDDAKIIDGVVLLDLRKRVESFAGRLATRDPQTWSIDEVSGLLTEYRLTPAQLIQMLAAPRR